MTKKLCFVVVMVLMVAGISGAENAQIKEMEWKPIPVVITVNLGRFTDMVMVDSCLSIPPTNPEKIIFDKDLPVGYRQAETRSVDKDGNIGGVVDSTMRVSEDFIKRLGKEGIICEVFGHQWQKIYDNYLVYYPNGATDKRQCVVCGKVEIKDPGEWK